MTGKRKRCHEPSIYHYLDELVEDAHRAILRQTIGIIFLFFSSLRDFLEKKSIGRTNSVTINTSNELVKKKKKKKLFYQVAQKKEIILPG